MNKNIIWASHYIHSLVPNERSFEALRFVRKDEASEIRSRVHDSKMGRFCGQSFDLPLQGGQLFSVLKLAASMSLWKGLLFSRIKQDFSKLTGLSTEIRSYEDFLVDQYGSQFYDLFWSKYIQMRWGVHGSQLSSQLAKMMHVPCIEHSEMELHSHKPAVFQQARALSFSVDDEKIIVNSEIGNVETERLFIDAPIDQICKCLEDIPIQVKVALMDLKYVDQKWVVIEGQFDDKAVHLLNDSPFYCIIPVGPKSAKALYRNDKPVERIEVNQWLQSQGYSISNQVGIIQNFAPLWTKGAYTKYLLVLDFLAERKVYPIGIASFVPCYGFLHQRYIGELIKGKPAMDSHRALFDHFVEQISIRTMFLN